MQRLQIQRQNLSEASWIEQSNPALQPGEVRFALQNFALSANNITYADLGERFSYWQFFPIDAGFGLLPIWGFAQVVESTLTEFPVGSRAYGYFPLASHCVLQPKATSGAGFVDQSPHRSTLPAVYQLYQRWQQPPVALVEARYALLRPLYMTSWLCADFLHGQNCFGAEQIVILSASSKTALSLGQALSAVGSNACRVALTSGVNIDFCKRSQCYDAVLGYDQLDQLPPRASVLVDMAGNPELLRGAHHQLASNLLKSVSVGLSHRGDLASALTDLAGPKPELFFAPTQVKKRISEHGPGWIERTSNAHWQAFLTSSESYLSLRMQTGADAILSAYRALLNNEVQADQGLGFQFKA